MASRDKVAVNDATNVIFELKNQSKKKIQFDTSRDNHGVEIHIPVGDLASDFVTEANNVAEAISSYLDDNKFGEFSKLSSTDGLVIYRWQPSKPSLSGEVYSAPIEPNSTLLFGLAGIIPNQTQGLVNIKIVLRGVRDLATLAYSVNLMKVTKDIATFVGNDKVGIGTGDSEPLQKLDVRGNSYVSGNAGIGVDDPKQRLSVLSIEKNIAEFKSETDGASITISSGDSNEAYVRFQNTDTVGSSWMVGMDDDEKYKISYGTDINNTNAMVTVQQNGNVGIGVPVPRQKLEVNGSISAG